MHLFSYVLIRHFRIFIIILLLQDERHLSGLQHVLPYLAPLHPQAQRYPRHVHVLLRAAFHLHFC